ncbi:MAG: bifunctional oligoribonuclease/PAP phosphatase NrnA [Clostridia bacterium]
MIDELKLKKFSEYLDKAKTVALICHMNPDGDSLGSALALAEVLKKLGKQADVFCDDLPSEKLKILPFCETINTSKLVKFDVAIAVDCSDADRFAISGRYFKKANTRLVIDHHKTNNNFADYTICDQNAAATAEVVFYLIKFLEQKYATKLIDDETASLLFSALVTDSGCFSFSNTTTETHFIASELVKFNFKASDIIFKLIKSQTLSIFKLKSRVLNKAKFYENNRIGIITFTAQDFLETEAGIDNTEGIINEIINILGVDIAIAVSEVNEKYYKISVRTKAPYDASECAGVFGGGGHERAAGCRVSGFYEDVIDKLLKASRDLIL